LLNVVADIFSRSIAEARRPPAAGFSLFINPASKARFVEGCGVFEGGESD